jgi:hypothetical protein
MMQNVLAWLKANVLIVVMNVLVLVLPPAGIVGASIWNGKIRAAAEDAYKKEKQSLDSAKQITYTIPSITPGEEAVTIAHAPNDVMTEFVKAERDRRQAELERVVRAAVAFNKGSGRELLVKGLFPQPPSEREGRDQIEGLAQRLVGGDGVASAYQALFDGINAGLPPDEAGIARVVTDAELSERERLLDASGADKLTEEEQATLRKRLVGLRVSALQDRAREISVYGSAAALGLGPAGDPNALGGTIPGTGYNNPGTRTGRQSPGSGAGGSSLAASPLPSYPFDAAAERPGVGRAFIWQWDYWFVQDLLAAIGSANTTPDGLDSDESFSAVKRIVSIELDAPVKVAASDPFGAGGGGGFPSSPPSYAAGGADPVDDIETGLVETSEKALSHTGRASGDQNQTFDVRTATITVVAASDRLGRFLDALVTRNLMTVIGVQLSAVDIASELDQGYFYGEQHVVRAEIRVESVWLRLWTVDMMPKSLKAELGVQETAPVETPLP